MKVGIMPLFGGDTAAPDYVARIARGLEQRGFYIDAYAQALL